MMTGAALTMATVSLSSHGDQPMPSEARTLAFQTSPFDVIDAGSGFMPLAASMVWPLTVQVISWPTMASPSPSISFH